jgi:glucose/arabinose dehydrogenase
VRGRLLIVVLFALVLGGASNAAPRIRVPAGFRVEVYASGLEHPTAMAWSRRGRLYVTEEGGAVVSVSPGSSKPRVEARGFATPLGLVWARGALYVSAQGTLWRISGRRKHVVLGKLPFGEHQQDNVVLGPDGRLYLGSGSTCDACRERSRLSATILSVRPDGSDLRVVARGLRNPYGLAFDGDRLYVSVNNRDKVPSPAETIVGIRPGRFYGWPACWANWRRRALVGRCAGVTQPLAYLEPHSSADGMAFWHHRLFVAEWGQYYAHTAGRRIVELVPHGRTWRHRVFASGTPHPLALVRDRRGDALLVADWQQGVIYRIVAAAR